MRNDIPFIGGGYIDNPPASVSTQFANPTITYASGGWEQVGKNRPDRRSLGFGDLVVSDDGTLYGLTSTAPTGVPNGTLSVYKLQPSTAASSSPATATGPCDNIDNRKRVGADNYLTPGQTFGQSIVTSGTCYPGSKFFEFSWMSQGNAPVKVNL